MRISVRQLRRVIKEAVEGEMGMPGNMPTGEGGVIEMHAPYFKSDPGLLEKIVFRICPDLFVGYDSGTGIVKFYDPAGDADLEHDLARCKNIISVFDDTNSAIVKYAMRPHLY